MSVLACARAQRDMFCLLVKLASFVFVVPLVFVRRSRISPLATQQPLGAPIYASPLSSAWLMQVIWRLGAPSSAASHGKPPGRAGADRGERGDYMALGVPGPSWLHRAKAI